MKVTFKLFPNQMLTLGICIGHVAGMDMKRQTSENFIHDIIQDGKKTGFTIDTGESELSFEGTREEYKKFDFLPNSCCGGSPWKLRMTKYEDPGMTWMKPWENLKDITENRANKNQVIMNLKRNPDLKVDVNVILDRFNLCRLDGLMRDGNWKLVSAGFDKADVDFVNELIRLTTNKQKAKEPVAA